MASKMAIKVIYLCNLLKSNAQSMGFPQDPDTLVYEDNTICIDWENHVIRGRERAEHIDPSKHFAHETIQNRQMRLIKDTSKQLADLFTKALRNGCSASRHGPRVTICPSRAVTIGSELVAATRAAPCAHPRDPHKNRAACGNAGVRPPQDLAAQEGGDRPPSQILPQILHFGGSPPTPNFTPIFAFWGIAPTPLAPLDPMMGRVSHVGPSFGLGGVFRTRPAAGRPEPTSAGVRASESGRPQAR